METQSKGQHTQGTWTVTDGNESYRISDSLNRTIAHAEYGWQKPLELGEISEEEAEANAKLIAEAGTVANECGLTPRQLLEQRNELLRALGDTLAEISPAYNFDLRKSEGAIKAAYELKEKLQATKATT